MYRISQSYDVFDVDLDLDGHPDKVVSSAQGMGKELIFFLRDGNGYREVLRGTNLAEDGGRVFGGVNPVVHDPGRSEVLTITNFFPKGADVAVHYISYGKEGWVLSRTIYIVSDWRRRGSYRHHCEVVQGIPLQELALGDGGKKVQELPEEANRDEVCEKE
ncbi:hypothetical protein WCE55_12585 [Luteimonas sp. MJ293]|uniref:hypothetical protein n=1 Tax=Luteimonas sp. MJ146 TaxID=3129240 RepID=UPI0031B9E748